MNTTNPWMQEQIEREMHFTGGEYSRATAEAVVRGEYASVNPSTEGVPHECGGAFWFKATVGAWKCDGCGALARIHTAYENMSDPLSKLVPVVEVI